jgi:pyridoxine/pyridoxamine 5'-phosphate oxidase
MRLLLEWVRSLARPVRFTTSTNAVSAYHARRYAQERALERKAGCAASRQAHATLAAAHRCAMEAALAAPTGPELS